MITMCTYWIWNWNRKVCVSLYLLCCALYHLFSCTRMFFKTCFSFLGHILTNSTTETTVLVAHPQQSDGFLLNIFLCLLPLLLLLYYCSFLVSCVKWKEGCKTDWKDTLKKYIFLATSPSNTYRLTCLCLFSVGAPFLWLITFSCGYLTYLKKIIPIIFCKEGTYVF